MVTKQKSKMCNQCLTFTLHEQTINVWSNSTKYAVITMMTCGLAIPFVAMHMFMVNFTSYRCQTCGGK